MRASAGPSSRAISCMLKVTLKRAFKGIWKFHGSAEVDGVEVASAEIMVAPETKGHKGKGEPG